MLNPRELQIFLAAAETENFSEAARRLSISQPAISMQIRSLEEKLKVPLFTRTGRQVTLTDPGRVLIPMARDVIDHTIHLEEAMASLQGEVVGVLKLGCSTAAGKYVIPKLMAGFHKRFPRVGLICDVTGRHMALEKLREGDVQLALTSLREPYKGIEYRPFLTDRIVLIVPPDHPWAALDRPLKPKELLAGQFILRESQSGTRGAVVEGLSWHDMTIDDLEKVMVLGNSEAICGAVQERIGVAFVSMSVACEASKAGTVVPIQIENMDLTTTLFMARDTDRPATRAQAAYWEFAFSPENEHIRRQPSLPPDTFC
ncbi:HTH-type transcriptional activator CmpR [bacterium BMS3Abin02]|nr:HTH-type transcriptional activator CmpR [bacterium BMS3Abin02]GBE22385.1 HTH-type transcriptional activator CmpR [bacterium BMS3Bbin01]HDH24856.1 LysR family transcriptional regulator [Actinomycetota bacterium]HDL49233.1 LysR family transcriptional regulator [Actinomycetota bacterium]